MITSPPEKTKYTFLPGRTAKITWKYDDVTGVEYRSWTLKKYSNGPAKALASISNNETAQKRTTLYDFGIQKPATLLLRNVNQSYNGIYSFTLAVLGVPEARSVTVFIASKFS